MMNLYGLFVLLVGLLNAKAVVQENEYYPGLRKPPQSPNWPTIHDENAYLLAQLSNIIEEQARRRLHQQWQQKQQQKLLRDQYPSEIIGDGFTYRLPIVKSSSSDDIPFAVGPSDPRYYESDSGSSSSSNNANNANNANNNQYPQQSSNFNKNDLSKDVDSYRLSIDGIPSNRPKAPMEVNPKININDNGLYEANMASKSKDVMSRDDIKMLVEKLQQNNQQEAIVNAFETDVLKKRMDTNPAVGMYVIALIAGVSAAVTVGLLAVGIGWYTLQKKAKAAADVEYPAYGITGPNRDVSPSGDRRLAHSAQMYHYQHQKQQIIAMENQTNGDRNGSLSDVETDEENEEGDYTVYECPGLAPTGEMEVKNPLFLDDPTPVQKGTTAQKPEPQQPQQPQHPPPPPPSSASQKSETISAKTSATKEKK